VIQTAKRRVLVVEDDFFIASDLASALRGMGAEVVGPAPNRNAAIELIDKQPVNAAVLDICLDGDSVYPLASELRTRGINFVFATGYSDTVIPAEFRGIPCFEKPMRPLDLARSVLDNASANREVDVRANTLLSRMPDDEFDRFRPHFSCVQTKKGATLFNPGDKIDQIFFPLSGICSLVVGDDPVAIEAGMIGRDGMLGASLLMGVTRLPMRCVVQIEGEALAIAADQFLARLRSSPRSWALLLRYQHYLHLQTNYSLLGTGAGSIEQRVARLLLMLCDRIGDDIPIIHDVMSTMLHVRRAGVTQALHILEGNGAIRARRGRVSIRSREGLEQVAGVAYGPAETEYERLIGVPLRAGGHASREGVDRAQPATGQDRASARHGLA
jgi:CRP-like cAMP-binding protein